MRLAFTTFRPVTALATIAILATATAAAAFLPRLLRIFFTGCTGGDRCLVRRLFTLLTITVAAITVTAFTTLATVTAFTTAFATALSTITPIAVTTVATAMAVIAAAFAVTTAWLAGLRGFRGSCGCGFGLADTKDR